MAEGLYGFHGAFFPSQARRIFLSGRPRRASWIVQFSMRWRSSRSMRQRMRAFGRRPAGPFRDVDIMAPALAVPDCIKDKLVSFGRSGHLISKKFCDCPLTLQEVLEARLTANEMHQYKEPPLNRGGSFCLHSRSLFTQGRCSLLAYVLTLSLYRDSAAPQWR